MLARRAEPLFEAAVELYFHPGEGEAELFTDGERGDSEDFA